MPTETPRPLYATFGDDIIIYGENDTELIEFCVILILAVSLISLSLDTSRSS